jgi:hypothetical protein
VGGLRIGKADPEGTPDGDGKCLAAPFCQGTIAGSKLHCMLQLALTLTTH